MILVHKIQYRELEPYKIDYLDSLRQNMSNSLITKILIFSDLDVSGIPKNSKVNFSLKKGYSEVDILKYVRNIHKNDTIIWANPYATFNHTLIKASNYKNIIQLSSYCNGLLNKNSMDALIFNNIQIDDSKVTVNESLIGERIDASLNIIINNKRPSFNSLPIQQVQTKHFEIKRNIQKETTIEKQPIDLQSRRHIAKKESIKVDQGGKIGKMDTIIVSVDYNDFLVLALENNIKYLDNITVVTSSKDSLCKEICNKFGVKCVITDRMYENGAKFNKGKAINEGIKSIQNPEWILLLDSDIVLTKDWNRVTKLDIFDKDSIHICSRNIVESYDEYQRWSSGESVGRLESPKGFGYFQLFNVNSNAVFGKNTIFPETSDDAAWSDLSFRNQFGKKVQLPMSVVHLGRSYSNWKGRETEEFIDNNQILKILNLKFNINEYFDNIYCLNLNKRQDRWSKVSEQFNRFSIDVERFEAIDGELISDDEFNIVNPNKISGENASANGIIENKSSLACLLSHIEIIKDAREKGYKKILIFEDDVMLRNDFNTEISKISDLDWKLLYLGCSQFNWSGIKIDKNHYLSKNSLGTFAYAIDSSIYDMVLDILDTKRKSVDNLLSDIQNKIQGYCYTIYPNIAISDVNDSDIREHKDMLSYSKDMKWVDLESYKLKSISIIIPCFGHSKFIEECVDSCLSQTIKPSEIIILLMDEISISMKDILEKKSKLIKCLIGDKMNLSSARNKCVENVTSDYFIPLDADDKIPENFIQEVSKINADVVYVGSKYFGAYSGTWPDPITEEIDWDKLTTFRRNSLVCTSLIKKDKFLSVGRYTDELWAFEDMDLWIRMHSVGCEFKKCFTTWLFYRKHTQQNSLLNKANSDKSSLRKIIMENDNYKKIPKIIHWVWLGEKEKPYRIIESWKKILPEGEWEYKLWNEENIDIESSEFLSKSYKLKKYGICVDIIRSKVLYEYGGIWLDADCLINNDISPFLQYNFFGCWENENYINIGLIGASPKLETMKNIFDYYNNLSCDIDTLMSQKEFVSKIGTGPMILTRELLKTENIRNGGFSKTFNIGNMIYRIETPDTFVLDDSKNNRINYAVHLYDGSWTDNKEKWSDVVLKSYNNWKIKNNLI